MCTGVLFVVCVQACDNGRGAVLMSVARGKVSEGIDFGLFMSLLYASVYCLRYFSVLLRYFDDVVEQ